MCVCVCVCVCVCADGRAVASCGCPAAGSPLPLLCEARYAGGCWGWMRGGARMWLLLVAAAPLGADARPWEYWLLRWLLQPRRPPRPGGGGGRPPPPSLPRPRCGICHQRDCLLAWWACGVGAPGCGGVRKGLHAGPWGHLPRPGHSVPRPPPLPAWGPAQGWAPAHVASTAGHASSGSRLAVAVLQQWQSCRRPPPGSCLSCIASSHATIPAARRSRVAASVASIPPRRASTAVPAHITSPPHLTSANSASPTHTDRPLPPPHPVPHAHAPPAAARSTHPHPPPSSAFLPAGQVPRLRGRHLRPRGHAHPAERRACGGGHPRPRLRHAPPPRPAGRRHQVRGRLGCSGCGCAGLSWLRVWVCCVFPFCPGAAPCGPTPSRETAAGLFWTLYCVLGFRV